MSIAVIFDMDGVIVDNIPYHTQAWKKFCSLHGFSLTDEEFNKNINGRIAKESLQYIYKRALTTEETARFTAQKESLYREAYKLHLAPTEGLVDFLESLKVHNVMLGVATSAPTINLDFVLDNLKLRQYFDITIDSTSVTKGKPDPEIYLKAASLLKVEPKNCIVVEDSLAGVAAGLNAKMTVIGITTTHTSEELKNTHLTIKNFKELSYKQIISLTDRVNILK